MPWTSEHIKKWLVDTGERLKTADGKEVEVWAAILGEGYISFDYRAEGWRWQDEFSGEL